MKLGIKYLEPDEDENNGEDDHESNGENEESLRKTWDNLQESAEEDPTKSTDEVQESIQPTQPKPKSGPIISVVAEEYYEEMKLTGVWSPKRSAISRFIEIAGDITVDTLSHSTARKYKRTLLKLPANMRKDPRYRDLSIMEILKLEKVKPIAINTVNNNISSVVALMSWARKHGFIPENYFEGLKVQNKKKAQDERKPFSNGDLKKIFNSDLYLQETKDSTFRYWVPLLGLFTGARINELCQLHVADIKYESGMWCMDINDESNDSKNPKKLKNLASARVIPIHPQLIELGFIKFMQKQKKLKVVRLFPELTLRIDGFYRKPGRWFNESYLRKKVGIKDPDRTFHSFRHTVIDGLKQKGVGESYISEYVGHSSGDSETFGRYGKQYKLRVLMEEVVKKIEYGLNFEKLMLEQK